jgi:putative transposase
MSTEIQRRQSAIRMWLAGKTVTWICQKLQRGRDWFYRWWGRYQDQGADGLRDRSRAPKTYANRIADEVQQAIVKIRDRLVRRRGPQARYRLAGAPTIRHELEVLGYRPLPSLRTIGYVLQRAGRTCPPFRLEPKATTPAYPGPQARFSNHIHQLDLVGPRYLTGSRTRYYFLVYKDVYDLTPFIGFSSVPDLEVVLKFLVQAWQCLGLPQILQVDNGALFAGTGRWPGSLDRFIRLALLVGVELVFIPEGEPFRNGSVENFNGWFQDRLLAIQLRGPAQVRRELKVLMDICSREHVHPQLGFRTSCEVRRGLHARRLPANFQAHLHPMPVAIGRVIFIRKVRRSGRITILGVKIRAGQRLRGRYVQANLYTRNAKLNIHHGNKLVKTVDFPLRGV